MVIINTVKSTSCHSHFNFIFSDTCLLHVTACYLLSSKTAGWKDWEKLRQSIIAIH